MRVEYTLPGMQPSVTPQAVQAATAGGPYGPGFKDRLRQLATNFQANWRQVLGLDQIPAGGTNVGPPPKPANLETRDPAATRLQWRRLIDRHSSVLSPTASSGDMTPATNAPLPKVQRMQVLLMQMQQMEDGVTARSLTATRG